MRSPHDGHHHMQDAPTTPHAEQDEGQRQLDRLIEALTATRTLVEQQSQRYAGTQSLVERGDILHASIIEVEDRLSPQCRLDEIARVRDAMYIIAGRRSA